MEDTTSKKPKVLAVDDDIFFLELLKEYLTGIGYEMYTLNKSSQVMKHVENLGINVLLLDIKMPEMSGVDVFHLVNQKYKHIPVIIISGQDDIQLAVQIMKEGGYYYLSKPVDLEQLNVIIRNALEATQMQRDIHELKLALKKNYSFGSIIGKNQKMQTIFQSIKIIAPSSSTVLIMGESGTGKEMIAQAIHLNSPRNAEAFIAINCGAIPSTLIESELFGFEKGAFTGAINRKIGKFELAHKGTLFLDEIGELTPEFQVKLLRVLQEKMVTRIGGTISIPVDVRIIAATNRNLREEVNSGNFRKDLFYRLSVLPITIPPLRDRRDDILLLIQHFLEKYTLLEGKKIQRIHPDVLKKLYNYDYPGNVRELENIIERAVVVCQKDEITEADLITELFNLDELSSNCFHFEIPEEGMTMRDMERLLIVKTLQKVNGNKSKAAQLLGITRKALYARLNEMQLTDTNTH